MPDRADIKHFLVACLALFQRLAATLRPAPPETSLDDEIRGLFDNAWYRAAYPDVGMDPFEHFVSWGEAEGRDPSATFSVIRYRQVYMADEPLDASPTRHFVRIGRALGYDPSWAPIDRYACHLFALEHSFGVEIPELLGHIELMTIRPRFLVFVDSDDEAVRAPIEASLRVQLYRDWTVCRREDVARRAQEAGAAPWFFIWLRPDDVLHACALYCFASAINADPTVDIVYGDEDALTGGRRERPFYKPCWSPDYLESCNYIGSGACVSGAIAEAVLPESIGCYDFLLRATDQALQVKHVRRILIHRSRSLDAPRTPSEIAAEVAALQGRLARTGRVGTVAALKPGFGCYDVKLQLRAAPLVSVVIPTAGRIVEMGGRTIDLIFNCLQTIEDRSSYKNLEFFVVDNGDIDAARMQALRDRGVSTLAYDRQEINISKKLNIGAVACRGDFLLLLHDDIEPLTTDWIERMLEQFEKPNVGVVGAKLVYTDMTIQHAGVIFNRGTPDHPRTRFPRDDDGYMFSTCAVRNFLAVTGAAMLVPTALFREVGGFTESLTMTFNDADFCLKLRENGKRAVYTSRAELIHHAVSSGSHAPDQTEVSEFHRRWAATATTDPFYNEESLAVAPATYEVEQNGRLIR